MSAGGNWFEYSTLAVPVDGHVLACQGCGSLVLDNANAIAAHNRLHPPSDARREPEGGWVTERIGRRELDRLRSLLVRPDRDRLTPWEVVEIAADELTAVRTQSSERAR